MDGSSQRCGRKWLTIARPCPENLFSALCGTYTYNCTVTLNELKAVLKGSTIADESTTPQATKRSTQEEGFLEVRRHKRQSSNEAAQTSKKPVVTSVPSALNITPKAVPT
jgi:hypothetical protein